MSRRDNLRIAGAACLAAALHLPALAESLASSASSAGSASSGSASDSIKGSSNSSGAPAKVAAGDYRIAVTTDLVARDLQEVSTLESLMLTSLPVTIATGERKTLNIKTSGS